MGIDNPRGASDRPVETDRRPEYPGELWSPRSRDITTWSTLAQIEHDRRVTRGELRYRNDRWEPDQPYDWARRQDLRDRILKEVRLPERVRELPLAGDVLPRAYAEIARNKFAAYSLNEGHPQNRGKAEGWRALGFRLETQQDRLETAEELREMTRLLLPAARVAATTSSPYGDRYKVLTGYIGPNGAHGTLITCWMVDGEGDHARPRMTTTWMQPHRDKGGWK